MRYSADSNGRFRYYHDGSRPIEERRDYGGQLGFRVVKQYYWGQQYVDELLCVGVNIDPQDSSETSGGACERWFWALHDANYNVIGLLTSAGVRIEGYEYTPYGQRTVYSRNWLLADMDDDGDVDGEDSWLMSEYVGDTTPNSRFDLWGNDGQVTAEIDNQVVTDAWNAGQAIASADASCMAPRLDSCRGLNALNQPVLPVDLCDIGMQGKLFDKEWGRHVTPTRMYNPTLARWDQRDYIGGDVDGPNLYQAYVSNPIRMVDPQGTWSQDIHLEMTYALAMAAGFNDGDSRIIAQANNGVDFRQNLQGGYVERVFGTWVQKTLWDIWHLPGAYVRNDPNGDPPFGPRQRPVEPQNWVEELFMEDDDWWEERIDAEHNEGTVAIHNMLRTAAYTGEGQVVLNYGHADDARPEPIPTPEGLYILRSGINAVTGQRQTRIHITVAEGPGARRARLEMLGVFLHSLQDAYAHEGGRTGHHNWMVPEFDHSWRRDVRVGGRRGRSNFERAQNAAQRTYRELVDFLDSRRVISTHFNFRARPSIPWDEPLPGQALTLRGLADGLVGAERRRDTEVNGRRVRGKEWFYNQIVGLQGHGVPRPWQTEETHWRP